VHVRLAHAGLLKAFLEGLGIAGEEEAGVLDQVFAGNLRVLGSLAGGNPEAERQLQMLFSLKGDAPGFVENLRSVLRGSRSALAPSLDDLAGTAEMLTRLGCGYQIDFTSGRNFEYYTGIIFGFYCDGRRLGGGGRYDELVPLVGGKDIRASGFALSLDRLMALIEEPPQRERVLLVAGDDLKENLALARMLRDAGHIVEFALGSRARSGFRWVVDMRSGGGCDVTDKSSGRKRSGLAPSDVLKLIGEAACR
jgi:histidyl-tRNA synthetase